eukprot:1027858-Prorocentrum_minimum.AAC.1
MCPVRLEVWSRDAFAVLMPMATLGPRKHNTPSASKVSQANRVSSTCRIQIKIESEAERRSGRAEGANEGAPLALHLISAGIHELDADLQDGCPSGSQGTADA